MVSVTLAAVSVDRATIAGVLLPRGVRRSHRPFAVRSLAVLAAVSMLAVAGCSRPSGMETVPSDEAPTAAATAGPEVLPGPDDPRPRTLAEYEAQRVSWGSCDGFATDGTALDTALDCGRVLVPLDYDDPAGPLASLALSRAPATGPVIGSMLVNPGGPGASGLSTATVARGTPVADRLDVVGFDPRGIGASVPAVRCDTAAEFDAERADDDVDTSPAGIAETESENRAYAQRCADRNDPVLLAHMSSEDVARDMDVIRAALGDRALTYLGFSYGTRLGYTYAELFPDRVRAMVLDGALDPAADVSEETVAQAAGFQTVFDAFATDCAARADCPLGTTPADAVARFRALVDPLIGAPVPAGNGRALSYDDAITGVQQALYTEQLWEPLRRGLTELASGRGTVLLALADLYNGRLPDGSYTNSNDAFTAVRCVDDPRIQDRAETGAVDREFRAAAPFLDDGRGTGEAPLDSCAFWPVPTRADPGPLTVTGLPPTVVVSTTADPATPYEAGVALADQLGAALVTFEGDRHTASFDGVACVDDAVTDYLVDLTVPPAGLRCP